MKILGIGYKYSQNYLNIEVMFHFEVQGKKV